MKIARISLLLLIVAAVVVSGCKTQQSATLAEEVVPSNQVDSGLEELNEIDTLAEETDLGLEEIEKMELE